MPHMDGTGPDPKRNLSGRRLGKCANVSNEEALQRLGIGMGMQRKKSSCEGNGKGKRLQSFK